MRSIILSILAVYFLAAPAWPVEISRGLPADLIPVQQAFYHDAFRSFLSDLRSAAPQLGLKSNILPSPPFDSTLPRNAWIERFSNWISEKQSLSSTEAAKLKSTAEEMFFSYYHGEPFARVPFLTPLSTSTEGSAETISVKPLILLKEFPKNHTLDVNSYVNARFPQEFRNFLSSHNVPLYAHDSNCGDTISYHKKQGYTHVQRFQGSRDNSDSPYLIIQNPKNTDYRFAVCEVKGKDALTRISQVLGPTLKNSGGFVVHHAKPSPLFEFNKEGQALRIEPNDRVIIGFQNTIWWNLASSGEWERIPLTFGGADAALYRNIKTGQRIINTWNVYGDEMKETLQTFYKKGARRFVYLGTAGGLDPKLKIGDVLIPKHFLKDDGTWLQFSNTASQIPVKTKGAETYVLNAKQGWIATLIEESRERMEKMRDQQAQGIDIEARYFGEFFIDHPAAEKSVLLTISDIPLGTQTYDKENATRGIAMASVKRFLPDLLAMPVPIGTSDSSDCNSSKNNSGQIMPEIKITLPDIGTWKEGDKR